MLLSQNEAVLLKKIEALQKELQDLKKELKKLQESLDFSAEK